MLEGDAAALAAKVAELAAVRASLAAASAAAQEPVSGDGADPPRPRDGWRPVAS